MSEILRGIKIDQFHTGRDWGAVMTAMSIPRPSVKTSYVSIDGADGSLDYTEAFGAINYENRELTFSFSLSDGTRLEREKLINRIVAFCHGQNHKIIIDDDPAHYFFGRCAISDVGNSIPYGVFTLTVTAEPWFYSVYETIRKITLTSTSAEVLLINSGVKTVIPTIETTAKIKSVAYNGTSHTLNGAGTYELTDCKIKGGELLKMTISGTKGAIARIKYREAIL